jgi:predicted dehydrogenase
MDGSTTDTRGVAIIGAGERGVYYVGSRMAESAAETGLRIVGVHDRLPDRARLAADHLNALYARVGINHKVSVFGDVPSAVTDGSVDLVLVTTHTNAHRAPVEAALAAGRHVYLDKPISVTLEDALAIGAAEARAAFPVMMGFTRRYETPWIETVRLAHAGVIGTPQMILLRSVIPYTRYLQLWHREQALSGGALNDKGSHHYDVLNWIAEAPAIRVTAQGGRSGIFAPDPTAPARCRDCDRDCPYRRHETLIDKAVGVDRVPNESWVTAVAVQDRNDTCVFLPGSDIDDHAVVMVTYENGIVACHFFAIFGPYAEDQETLEIVGSSGRLRMERHSGAIDCVTDYGRAHEVLRPDVPDRSSSHFGADLQLVRALRRYLDGEAPPVGVREGIASLRLVLAAQKSLSAGGRPVDPRTGDWA